MRKSSKSPKQPLDRIQWYLRMVGRVTAIKGISPRKTLRMKRLFAYKLAMNRRLLAERGAIQC